MEQEIWKPINNFPGYEVSDKGRVRTFKKTGPQSDYLKDTPKIMRPGTHLNGYYLLNLRQDKVTKGRSVHRLVADAFIPNPDNLPLVRHIDSNPTNNCVENLAWGTQKDNMQDMYKSGRANTSSRYNITWCLISPEGHPVQTKNLVTFSEKYDLDKAALRNVCRGRRKSHKGWTCNVCPIVV